MKKILIRTVCILIAPFAIIIGAIVFPILEVARTIEEDFL